MEHPAGQSPQRTLVLALSGVSDVLAQAVREDAGRAGARSLQVNVRDEAVSGAFSMSALEPPADAFLTLTGPVSVGGLAEDLRRRADVVRGWWVESLAPIPPVETADGQRLDALANIAVLRRPSDLTPDVWRRRWQEDHTSVAIATQATFGYVQHRVVDVAVPGSPDVAAIVEEHFPMAAVDDIHAFYGSGGDDIELRRRMTAMVESVARFGADRDLDVVPTSRYLWRLG